MTLFRTFRYGLSSTILGGITTTRTFICRLKALDATFVPNDVMVRVQKRYGDPIYGYVRRRFPSLNAEDALEVTNKVLFDLAKPSGLPTFDSVRGFRQWLRTIARNKAIAKRRYLGQKMRDWQVTVSVEELGELDKRVLDAQRDGDTPAALLDRLDARNILREAIQSVHRDKIKLGREDEFHATHVYLTDCEHECPSYEEAAGKLGVSGVSFKKAVSRLRQALRRKLERRVREYMPNASNAKVDEEIREILTLLLPKPPVTIFRVDGQSGSAG